MVAVLLFFRSSSRKTKNGRRHRREKSTFSRRSKSNRRRRVSRVERIPTTSLPGIRFGQTESRELFAFRLRHEIFCFCSSVPQVSKLKEFNPT
jgi:hypothetical protein